MQMMRREVNHYTRQSPNYAKAAKRLYNLLRLTEQRESAAYLRELFDEPVAQLYQVPGLLEAAQAALDPRSGIARATVARQIEQVSTLLEQQLEGDTETRLLLGLHALRIQIAQGNLEMQAWNNTLNQVRAECLALLNSFFRQRLEAVGPIREYIAKIGS
jgi:hypothetical protein